MKRQVFLCLCAVILVAASAGAQSASTLAQTAAAPKVDGVISAKEYSVSVEGSGMQLAIS